MFMLSRRLPSGRIINIDAMDGALFHGGLGIAHLNMDNGDNSVTNLKYVDLAEAQALLLQFIDGGAAPAPGGHVNARGEGTEERPLDLDFEA